MDAPEEIIQTLSYRKQCIGQGELLAGPLALWLFEEELRGKSVTWYIDNVSAQAALIKGSSPVVDSCPMALVSALHATRLGCMVWYEYVGSAHNTSDILSREAWADPVAQRKLIHRT